MSDKRWFVEWYQLDRTGGKGKATVGEGTNSYGDGPERIIGIFNSYEDADHICALHNASLDKE